VEILTGVLALCLLDYYNKIRLGRTNGWVPWINQHKHHLSPKWSQSKHSHQYQWYGGCHMWHAILLCCKRLHFRICDACVSLFGFIEYNTWWRFLSLPTISACI